MPGTHTSQASVKVSAGSLQALTLPSHLANQDPEELPQIPTYENNTCRAGKGLFLHVVIHTSNLPYLWKKEKEKKKKGVTG